MITSVEEAVDVVRNGTDIIEAQGAETGGHRSTFNVDNDPNNEVLTLVGTMTLVPQVVDALKRMEQEVRWEQQEKAENNNNNKKIQVIAAGGIADGRGSSSTWCSWSNDWYPLFSWTGKWGFSSISRSIACSPRI